MAQKINGFGTFSRYFEKSSGNTAFSLLLLLWDSRRKMRSDFFCKIRLNSMDSSYGEQKISFDLWATPPVAGARALSKIVWRYKNVIRYLISTLEISQFEKVGPVSIWIFLKADLDSWDDKGKNVYIHVHIIWIPWECGILCLNIFHVHCVVHVTEKIIHFGKMKKNGKFPNFPALISCPGLIFNISVSIRKDV